MLVQLHTTKGCRATWRTCSHVSTCFICTYKRAVAGNAWMLDPYPCYDYVSNRNIIWYVYIYIIYRSMSFWPETFRSSRYTVFFVNHLTEREHEKQQFAELSHQASIKTFIPYKQRYTITRFEWSGVEYMLTPLHQSNAKPSWIKFLAFYHLPHIGHTGYMCCQPRNPTFLCCTWISWGAFHCIIDRSCGPNIRQSVAGWGLKVPQQLFLVGGWTNPSEKYESKWESSPGRGENEKCLKPPTSFIWSSAMSSCSREIGGMAQFDLKSFWIQWRTLQKSLGGSSRCILLFCTKRWQVPPVHPPIV